MATALSHQGVYVQLPKNGLAQILPADTTTKKTIITAGAVNGNGNKLTGLSITNTDTNTYTVQIFIDRGGVKYLQITSTILLSSGMTNAAPPINMFANWILPVDNDGQKYLFLENGDLLQFSSLTTVAAGQSLNAQAVHSEF